MAWAGLGLCLAALAFAHIYWRYWTAAVKAEEEAKRFIRAAARRGLSIARQREVEAARAADEPQQRPTSMTNSPQRERCNPIKDHTENITSE